MGEEGVAGLQAAGLVSAVLLTEAGLEMAGAQAAQQAFKLTHPLCLQRQLVLQRLYQTAQELMKRGCYIRQFTTPKA